MSEALDNDKGYVQPDDEFGKKAFTMSVKDPIGDGLAKFECNLDDLFGVFWARDREKAEVVPPLALHLVGRPVDDREAESFPRDNLLAVSKFLAEASIGSEDHPWLGNKHAAVQGHPSNGQKAYLGGKIAKAAGKAVRLKGQHK